MFLVICSYEAIVHSLAPMVSKFSPETSTISNTKLVTFLELKLVKAGDKNDIKVMTLLVRHLLHHCTFKRDLIVIDVMCIEGSNQTDLQPTWKLAFGVMFETNVFVTKRWGTLNLLA